MAAASSPSRRHLVLLAGIVALAAALRFWALDLGLPNTAVRPDEREVLRHTAGFAAGDLNPRWFVYPNLFMYVAWLWTEGLLALRRLLHPTPDYATLLTTDLPRVILATRALSALVGTATVALVYAIGRRVADRTVALVAAALLAVDFLHVRDSHSFKTEPLLAAGTLVSLFLLARWVARPGRPRAIAAGVAIGLTAGCKYPGLFLLGPAWVGGVHVARTRGRRGVVPPADVVVIGLVAAAVFLATSPWLVLDWSRATDTAAFLSAALYAPRPEFAPPPDASLPVVVLTWFRNSAFWYHATVSVRHGSGLLFTVLVPVALARALRSWERPFDVLAASYCILHYLIAGASPVHLARYLTPIMPLLAVLVAELAVAAARRTAPAAPGVLVTCLTLALAAEPLAASVAADRIGARTDTRVLATRWMAEHLPAGAVVAQLGSAILTFGDPDLPPGMRRVRLKPGATTFGPTPPTAVTTHEHHALPFSVLDPAQMAALAPHLRLLAEFSPYADGPAGRFEREDAYYVPFYDFAGVERPGPLVRIYAWVP